MKVTVVFSVLLILGFAELAHSQDGSIMVWGANYEGQCDVPLPNEGFVAVAGGDVHSLGLKEDGSIVAWGYNSAGQCDVPSPNTGFVRLLLEAISASV